MAGSRAARRSSGSTRSGCTTICRRRDGDPDRVLECWTSLAALARETSAGRARPDRDVRALPQRRACWRRWPRPSTRRAAAAWWSGSARAGTSANGESSATANGRQMPAPARATSSGRCRCCARGARAADPGRRRRRAGAAPPRRAVRRRLQPHGLVRPGVLPPQARRAAPPLRRTSGATTTTIEKTASFTVQPATRSTTGRSRAAGIERFILYVDPPLDARARVSRSRCSETRQMSSGLTGTRVSSRPVAARSAATIAAVETTVGGSPTPLTP